MGPRGGKREGYPFRAAGVRFNYREGAAFLLFVEIRLSRDAGETRTRTFTPTLNDSAVHLLFSN